MRILSSLLAVTALGLGAAAVWLGTRERTLPAMPVPVMAGSGQSGPAESTPDSSPAGSTNELDWSGIENEDFKIYISNLRKVGCPEQTIRDIVIADLNKIFEPREAALRNPSGAMAAQMAPMPWERQANAPSTTTADERKRDYERRRELRAVQQEKATLARELLGIIIPLDVIAGWSGRNVERMTAALDALAPEKREAAREVQEVFWVNLDLLNERSKGKRGPEYLQEFQALATDRFNKLNQVLSPQELMELEMRTSNTGLRLGTQLNEFQPTDDEFRTLFQVRRELDEPYGGGLQANQVEGFDPGKLKQKEEEVAASLKAHFGPERYAQFEKAQDPTWHQLRKMEKRFGWESGKTEELYAEQKSLRDEIRNVQGALAQNEGRLGDAIKGGQTFVNGNPGAPNQELQKKLNGLQDRMLSLSGKMGNDAWAVFHVRNGDFNVPQVGPEALGLPRREPAP